MDDVSVRITVLDPGSSEYAAASRWAKENGARNVTAEEAQAGNVPPARSIAYWVKAWGGYTSTLTLPNGEAVAVSLEPWKDDDPETTFVLMQFSFRDPTKIGTKAPKRR